jgi:hypothetical protein
MKKACERSITRTGRFSSHTGRKTGYCIGLFNGAPMTQLMKAARHKDVMSAERYASDAPGQKQILVNNKIDVDQVTPKWKSIFIENYQMAVGSCFGTSVIDLPSIADKCVTELCMVPLNHPERSISFIAKQVTRYQMVGDDVEVLEREFFEKFEPAEAKKLKERMHSIISKRTLHPLLSIPSSVSTIQNLSTSGTGPLSLIIQENVGNVENQLRATSAQSPPVKKRGGDNDLLGRERVQKLKGLDKIKLMKEIYDTIPAQDRFILLPFSYAHKLSQTIHRDIIPLCTMSILTGCAEAAGYCATSF